jgi:uncharacterized membrane protein
VSRVTRWAPYGIATLFAVSGTLHLLRPRVFTPLIPPALPAPTEIVYATGVAELACAAGLARTASWAGPAAAALLVGILPGNVQMAVDATAAARRRRTPKRVGFAVVCWVRVPLQAPLVWAALQSGRRCSPGAVELADRRRG